MFSLTLKNKNDQFITLTDRETEYQVVNIEGLNPPPAQLNMTPIAGMDGARFNSSKLDTRNIVITVKINGDVPYNRQELYRIARTKEVITIYFKNERFDVFAVGYVETLECDLFSDAEYAQISIICMDPYFKDILESVFDISNQVALFQFPFAIDYDDPVPFSEYIAGRESVVTNNSESETGCLVTVSFSKNISQFVIRETDTGDQITLNYNFKKNDVLYINTNKGEKSVTLLRNGNLTNIFTALASGSVFFQLEPGPNTFTFSADSGTNDQYVSVIITFNRRFRGV